MKSFMIAVRFADKPSVVACTNSTSPMGFEQVGLWIGSFNWNADAEISCAAFSGWLVTISGFWLQRRG